MNLKDFAQEKNIRLLCFPELDEVDDQIALKTLQENFEKISRFLPEFSMVIQAKAYSKSGARRQHELKARISSSKLKVFATALEWNFLTALQECLKELRKEVQKKAGKN